VVISAATVVAVLIYAGAVWTWRAMIPTPTEEVPARDIAG
jgi:hypothetical protein